MKRLLLLTIMFVGAMQLSAQSFFNLSHWQVKKAGMHLGIDFDMLNNNLHQDYFLSNTSEEIRNNFSDINYSSSDIYQDICENPNLRFEVSLASPYFSNTEWRFGVNAIFSRMDAITYQNYDNHFGSSDYLSFNSYGNELSLETVVLKSLPFMSVFEVHGGVGTNIGFSYGNHLSIYGSGSDLTVSNTNFSNLNEVNNQVNSSSYEYFSDSYRLNNGINQRAYLQVGGSMTLLKRLELGMDIRQGVGYRGTFGAPVAITRLSAFSLSAKYVLQKPRNLPFTKN